MKNVNFAEEFITQSIFRIEESISRITNCLQQVSEEELWQRPNAASNSIGNLVLHLCGNTRQYIISSLGDQLDTRIRDEEFSVNGGYTTVKLLDMFLLTMNEALTILKNLLPENLLKVREVQGFTLSGIGIIIHVVEHLSYHTGQIAFYIKLLKNNDLGFYKDIDLNRKNIAG